MGARRKSSRTSTSTLREAGELPGVTPLGARDGEALDETRGADAQRAEALSAGRLRERDAGRAEDDHVLLAAHPLAGRERAHEGLVDAASGVAREVLHAHAGGDACILQESLESLVERSRCAAVISAEARSQRC